MSDHFRITSDHSYFDVSHGDEDGAKSPENHRKRSVFERSTANPRLNFFDEDGF
jgi:hypothetical protein